MPRTPEGDTLQAMCPILNKTISKTDPVRFADCLIGAHFLSQDTAENITSVAGHSAYTKVSELMSAVKSCITSFASGRNPEKVTTRFNDFVLLLHEQLELTNLAEQLMDKCRKYNYR